MISIPIRGQYEQRCNAAALEELGVVCLKEIDNTFPFIFRNWTEAKNAIHIDYCTTIPGIFDYLFFLHD
jgi:hypothetical protein